MIVNTVRLFTRIQAGLQSAEESVRDCAESCMSFLVLHLREHTVMLPPSLVPLYESLPE